MSHYVIKSALGEHLALLQYSTSWENVQFDPPAEQVYVEEHYLPARTEPVGMSDASSEAFLAIYQVNVRTPRDAGKEAGSRAADTISGHFRRGTTLQTDGLNIRCTGVHQAPALPDGDRWVIPVSVTVRTFIRP